MGMENNVPENSLIASLSESEQKDLFGEPVIQHFSKQIPHRNSNIRRERFVREYVLNGRNATQAAIEAGYCDGKKRESAMKYGSWLLTQPDVKECLSHYTQIMQAKDLIRADEIIQEIWQTIREMSSRSGSLLRGKEPLLTLLARIGGFLENEKVQVNNIVSVRESVAADLQDAENGEISRDSEASSKTGVADV